MPASSATPARASALTARRSPTAALCRPVSAAGAKAWSGDDDGDCEGIVPGSPGLICNDNNESPEIEDNVCIFNPLEGACNNTNDCVPFMGLPVACVLGAVLPIAAKQGMTIATSLGYRRNPPLRGRHLLRVGRGPWNFWARGRLRPESFAELDEASARGSLGLVADPPHVRMSGRANAPRPARCPLPI